MSSHHRRLTLRSASRQPDPRCYAPPPPPPKETERSPSPPPHPLERRVVRVERRVESLDRQIYDCIERTFRERHEEAIRRNLEWSQIAAYTAVSLLAVCWLYNWGTTRN